MTRLARRSRLDDVDDTLIGTLRAASVAWNERAGIETLLDRIGDARFVLLGEASHGTSEYYTWRRLISQRLIAERGFSFIAVEGDWPDCYRVNRYVKGLDASRSAREVLHAFERWPTWMWANEEMVELVEWLHDFNARQPRDARVGFYGLDVYSLWESMHAVLKYLKKHDGRALEAARRAFECFEPYGQEAQYYARAAAWTSASCEDEVIALLRELRGQSAAFDQDGRDGLFHAEQNALVARNAEAYYRTMSRGGPDSWNIRDRHMAETLERLMDHHGPGAKAIVWEHNTHVGDARATDMVDEGMVNVGQLVREGHAREGVVLVGFGSHHGRVIAARQWGDPMERMPVPPARSGSWEDLFHRATGGDDRLLIMDDDALREQLLAPRGHRAIGVVYRPQAERYGNYVPTVLPHRYDAFVYLDETTALRPLHVLALADGEVPETYPTGV